MENQKNKGIAGFDLLDIVYVLLVFLIIVLAVNYFRSLLDSWKDTSMMGTTVYETDISREKAAPDCAQESQILNYGRQCCAGMTAIAAVFPRDGNNCINPINANYDSQEFSLVCADCGNGICGPGENICNCAADCDPDGTLAGAVKACASDADCGICKTCVGRACSDADTDWGAGLYGCAAGEDPDLKRCYKGECRGCGGSLIFDSEAGRKGCWYLADPGTSCEVFCGERGCNEGDIANWKWGDDKVCSVGKKLTNCSKCSSEYEDGWWVPYHNLDNDTCYYYEGAGVYYSCYWGPKMPNIRRMCVCEY